VELQYKQDVELIGSNMARFTTSGGSKARAAHAARDADPGEGLGVLGLGLYTWGGASNPPNSTARHESGRPAARVVRALVTNAPQVWQHERRCRLRSSNGAPA